MQVFGVRVRGGNGRGGLEYSCSNFFWGGGARICPPSEAMYTPGTYTGLGQGRGLRGVWGKAVVMKKLRKGSKWLWEGKGRGVFGGVEIKSGGVAKRAGARFFGRREWGGFF